MDVDVTQAPPYSAAATNPDGHLPSMQLIRSRQICNRGSPLFSRALMLHPVLVMALLLLRISTSCGMSANVLDDRFSKLSVSLLQMLHPLSPPAKVQLRSIQ